MPQAELPTADQFFGAPKQLPTADEFFGQPPHAGEGPFSSEFSDWYAQNSTLGAVLHAFGQGVEQGWGSQTLPGLSDQTIETLRKSGVFNDYQKGEHSIGKAINEAVIRPAAAALDALLRGTSALTAGAQGAVAEQFSRVGAPALGRDIAALPEAFPLGGAEIGGLGIPHAPPAEIATARNLGVIGEGEEGYFYGPQKLTEAPADQAIKAQVEQQSKEQLPGQASPDEPHITAQPSAAPDIHAVARQIAPDVFKDFDALQQRKDVFRRWINELDETRTQAVMEQAPHGDEIAELQAKLANPDTTPRLAKKYQSSLDDLSAERDAYIEQNTQGDTSDMAKIRQKLLETDFAMRDLAPQVGRAYQEAQARMVPETGTEPPPEITGEATTEQPSTEEPTPTQPAEPASASEEQSELPAVPPEVQAKPEVTPVVDVKHISQDVAQKLVAAGRPADEAEAAGKLIASHYWARAARFNGAKGTGLDLYKADAPEIRAGRQRKTTAREREFAQSRRPGRINIADNARNTITLLKDADASTFIHETGHQWLEEFMQDAADPAAPPDLVKDAQTVRDWLGVEEGEQIPRKAHEQFARGFETYMMEGRAPSQGLARIFEQFRQWLTSIYQTVAKLRSPINDDIRDVFDRLIVQKPEHVAIASERQTAKTLADIHEDDAETTPPEKAAPVADQVRAEVGQTVRDKAPENLDELRPNLGAAAEVGAGEGLGPSIPDHGDEAGQSAGENGAVPKPGTIGAGGGEAAPQGNRVSDERKAERTEQLGPDTSPNTVLPDESAERLVDKAGNIRLDNLNTPEDLNAVLRQTADENGGFMDQRGVVSDAEVLQLAQAAGTDVTLRDLDNFAKTFGRGGLSSKVMKLRQVLVQSALDVRDKMAKAATGSDADVLAYAHAKTRHQMIQGTLSAITAEAGRTLRAFREIDGVKEAQSIADFLRDATGRTLFQLRQEAQLGLALDSPAKVSKFVLDSAKPTFGDMVLEYWINGLISGPATHTTYAIGNALLALWKAGPETSAASIAGAMRHAFGAEGARVMAGEVPAQLYGMMRGVRNGVVAAAEAAKTGRTTMLPGELENMSARQLAMSPLVNPRAAIPNFSIKGVPLPVGTLARLPARAIAVIHSFFRAMNYEREMAGLAYRTAALEGLDGEKLAARIGELETNPSPELMDQARQSATDLTLMGKGGELTQALSRLTNAKFLGFQWLKFVDPFVHISSNIIEQAILQRTPLGVLAPEIRADLMGRNGGVAQDMAIGRMAVGSALSVAVGSLAAEGLVNGSGPSDPKEARIYAMVNGPPHSVRIGDTWYSIGRLGPLGMMVGVAADLYEFAHAIPQEDATHLASQLTHAFTQNILDESTLYGPSNLIKALTDPDRYGASYVRDFLSSFVPYSVGMAQVARGIDPYSREARTLMDAVKAKIPWLSETLLPRYDVFGQEIPNKDAVGIAGLTAIYESKVNNDPVPQAMLRLGVFPAMPQRKIRGVQLSDQQYADYARLSGRMAKMRLDAIVAMPGFSVLPDGVQRDMIVKAMSGARETARTLVMMQNPSIIQSAVDAKLSKLRGPQTVH